LRATVCLVLMLLGVTLSWASAHGYQTQFPTPIGGSQTVSPPSYSVPGSTAGGMGTPYGASPAPTYGAAPSPLGGPTTAPSYGTGTTSPFSGGAAPSATTAPSLTAPPPLDMSPVTPGQVPGPPPSYGSVVDTPPPNWDPYAPPGTGSTAPVLPQDYYPPPGTTPESGKLQRLIDEIRLDYVMLAPRGSKKFGTNDLDLSASLALPFFYNQETPLLITPGFAFHWWEGPVGGNVPPGLLERLPPRVYDAYLGAAWNPRITPQLGADLAFRVGVYSDFQKWSIESLRYTGQGLLVLSLSPSFQVKGGIVYYDRVRIKMLPAAGIVWIPSPETEFSLVFPYPRVSRRLPNFGNTEWWLYCRGEYGGGSWAVQPDKMAGPVDQIDYNDIRVALGLEFDRMDKIAGLVEVGTAFERELLLRSTHEKYSPSTTIFLRAGLIR